MSKDVLFSFSRKGQSHPDPIWATFYSPGKTFPRSQTFFFMTPGHSGDQWTCVTCFSESQEWLHPHIQHSLKPMRQEPRNRHFSDVWTKIRGSRSRPWCQGHAINKGQNWVCSPRLGGQLFSSLQHPHPPRHLAHYSFQVYSFISN